MKIYELFICSNDWKEDDIITVESIKADDDKIITATFADVAVYYGHLTVQSFGNHHIYTHEKLTAR